MFQLARLVQVKSLQSYPFILHQWSQIWFFPKVIKTLGLPTAKVPEGTLQLPSWVDPMEQSSHTKVIQRWWPFWGWLIFLWPPTRVQEGHELNHLVWRISYDFMLHVRAPMLSAPSFPSQELSRVIQEHGMDMYGQRSLHSACVQKIIGDSNVAKNRF